MSAAPSSDCERSALELAGQTTRSAGLSFLQADDAFDDVIRKASGVIRRVARLTCEMQDLAAELNNVDDEIELGRIALRRIEAGVELGCCVAVLRRVAGELDEYGCGWWDSNPS